MMLVEELESVLTRPAKREHKGLAGNRVLYDRKRRPILGCAITKGSVRQGNPSEVVLSVRCIGCRLQDRKNAACIGREILQSTVSRKQVSRHRINLPDCR